MPRFSIIVPVYNVAPYLRECLDSVLAQTFTDWECLCVNDGSTDESGAILDDYAAKDPRFRVFHKSNGGVSVARNLALDNAKGEWVTFLDGDDVYSPEWLAVFRSLAEKVPHAELLRLRLTLRREFEIGQEDVVYQVFENEAADVWGWKTFTKEGWSWLNAIKRSSIEFPHLTRYVTGMRFMEDNLFLLSLLRNISCFVQGEFRGYYYRQREGSACGSVRTVESIEQLFYGLLQAFSNQDFYHSAEVTTMFCNVVRDWLLFSKRTRLSECRRIAHLFKKLREAGFVEVQQIQKRWRIGFSFFLVTRSVLIIRLLILGQQIYGKFRRAFSG